MATGSMTLRELVAIDTLATEVLAGRDGLDREVLWAHSCELDEPWRWLGVDELLLTVGFCVPYEPEEQVRFIRELNNGGIVGAVVGVRDSDLALTPEMLQEADRLGFPLMRTQPEVPWSAVSRHIAAASSVSQTSQVLTLAKLYELTSAGDPPSELATQVARLLGVQLKVIDLETGSKILESRAGTAKTAPLAEVTRRSYTLQRRSSARLEIIEPRSERLGSMVFVHLKRILEVETDRIIFRVTEQLIEHERAMAELLERGSSELISDLLTHDTADEAFVLLALAVSDFQRIARAALLSDVAAVVGRSHTSAHAIIREPDWNAMRELCEQLELQVGVSAPFERLADATGALSEARSALRDALSSGQMAVQFHGSRVSVLARSERESREIITEVLGPLAEDNPRAAVLRETLFTYLRHERSWAESSEELGVHRQTLAYRLRQVESLTGRSMSKTGDLAALWIAAQAWERYCSNTRSHTP